MNDLKNVFITKIVRFEEVEQQTIVMQKYNKELIERHNSHLSVSN